MADRKGIRRLALVDGAGSRVGGPDSVPLGAGSGSVVIDSVLAGGSPARGVSAQEGISGLLPFGPP